MHVQTKPNPNLMLQRDQSKADISNLSVKLTA